jgi:ketosteroid isomerase-like protein
MSEENVEIVRTAFDALKRRGFDEALAYVDPEIEFEPPIEALERPRSFKGHQALRERWKLLLEPFEDVSLEPIEFIDGDDETVIVVFRVRVRGRASKVPVEAEPAYVLAIRGGMILRMRAYLQKDQALEAAGLSE